MQAVFANFGVSLKSLSQLMLNLDPPVFDLSSQAAAIFLVAFVLVSVIGVLNILIAQVPACQAVTCLCCLHAVALELAHSIFKCAIQSITIADDLLQNFKACCILNMIAFCLFYFFQNTLQIDFMLPPRL